MAMRAFKSASPAASSRSRFAIARMGRFTKRIVSSAITIDEMMAAIVSPMVVIAESRAVARTLFCAPAIDVSSAARTAASASAICA